MQTEALRFPEDPSVSDDLKDLLSQMLHKVRCQLHQCYCDPLSHQ